MLFLSMHVALDSIPSTAKRKKRERGEKANTDNPRN
jgi:hypothetical protein